MADIKTRKVVKGTIKTINKSEVAGARMKQSLIKSKELADSYANNNRDDNSSPVQYANAKAASSTTAVRDRSIQATKVSTRRGREALRNRRLKSATYTGNYAKIRNLRSEAGRQRAAKAAASRAQSTRNKARLSRQIIIRIAQSIGRSAKAIAAGTKAMVTAIAAGGTLMVVIVIICVMFGSAFAFLGDNDESLDIIEGGGNLSIVQVASQQVGNVGGYKFWHWYGFNERQPWCACFVSWCANKCGFIQSHTIPKFALVSTGISWFKKHHRWAGRNYKPAPGDIIFFDWEGDGVRDHVGIVEKCDGRTVYTIEGNSGNRCRRKRYSVGSRVIYGYGVPEYPMPKEKKRTENNEDTKKP